jgi:hypothetical protein
MFLESESEAEVVSGHISDFEKKIKKKPFLKSTENKDESEVVNSNNKISEMDHNVTSSIRKPKPAIIDIGEVQQFVLPTPPPPPPTTTLATTRTTETLSTTTIETLTALKPKNSLHDSDEVLKQISFSETTENSSNEGK